MHRWMTVAALALLLAALVLWALRGDTAERDTVGKGGRTAESHIPEPPPLESMESVAGPGPSLHGQARLPLPSAPAAAASGDGPRSAVPPPRAAGRPGPDGEAVERVVRLALPDGAVAAGEVRITPLTAPPYEDEARRRRWIGPDGTLTLPVEQVLVVDVAVEGRQGRRLILDPRRGEGDVAVVYGTGQVYGTVRSATGLPAVGLAVRLSTHLVRGEEGYAPSAEGHVFSMVAVTDEEGAFAFTDLPVGVFIVAAVRPRDAADAERNMRTVRVTLGRGERVRVDLGDERVEPLLKGRLRYRDGVPVAKMVNLFLMCKADGSRLYVATDADGRYEQNIPSGTYEVEMVVPRPWARMAGMQLVPSSQTFTLHDRDAPPQSIDFPGTRIEGRLRGLDEDGDGRQQILASLTEAVGEPPTSRIAGRAVVQQRALVEADGTFVLDGLSPGRWTLVGTPRAIEIRQVHVEDARAVLHVELDVRVR